ncbi:hypothetical protein ACCO45_011542 [Purpureocillium lilacinum]|uniref:Uncharacterized protein n=1 Tax=Purpureocillium lilacinum TaxID=33203 RepID=A0ACC4DBF9_PURLI
MAPNPAAVGGLLRQVIHYHLDNAAYDNALFFSERLAAQDPKSGEATYLYALCHLRVGDYRSAYDVGKPLGYRGLNLNCAWVFAQACLALERYKDGIVALEKSRGLWSQKCSIGKHSSTVRTGAPDVPAVLNLLGKLHRGYGDKKKAISCFEEALKKNPFMWDAFTALCDMGINLRTGRERRDCGQQENLASSHQDPLSKRSALRNAASDMVDPFHVNFPSTESQSPTVDMFTEPGDDFMSKIQNARLRLGVSSNSQSIMDARRTRNAQGIDTGMEAPPRMNYRLGTAKRGVRTQDRSQEPAVELMSDAPNVPTTAMRSGAVNTADRKRTLSGHPVARSTNTEEPAARRSARLNMFKSSTKANTGGATTLGTTQGRELKKARPPVSRIMRPGSSGSSVGRVVSGNRKPLEDHGDVDHGETSRVKEASQPAMTRPPEPDAAKVEEALKWTLDLVKKLANGYYTLSRFQCQESLQALSALPPAHQATPWVLAQMGRAHYEQASYAEAEKFFRRLRVQAPSRLQDMEVYSTILWHLKRETDLSFLAHELVDAAWHSPQAWCALGNAWSLSRDPEQALKCFQAGHATGSELCAIAADRRHYNAYYGIGRVQERLGAYDKAYDHFYAAQVINPNNAVLICCMGTVLEKQKQMVQALNAYTKAAELAPRAAQTRYKKARALLTVGQIESAQRELMILKDLAPEEATVHFLLGTLYKNTGEKQLSVRHFTIALSLDPKAAPKD